MDTGFILQISFTFFYLSFLRQGLTALEVTVYSLCWVVCEPQGIFRSLLPRAGVKIVNRTWHFYTGSGHQIWVFMKVHRVYFLYTFELYLNLFSGTLI